MEQSYIDYLQSRQKFIETPTKTNEYIRSQNQIINENKKNIKPFIGEYNCPFSKNNKQMEFTQNYPITNYINKNCDNVIYKNNYINVDSSKRNIYPSFDTGNPSLLSNPFTFTLNSNNVTIKHPLHGLNVNDKIIISGITEQIHKLRTISSSGTYLFEFTNGSEFVKINYKHNIDLTIANSFDISDLSVTISGFKENQGNYFYNIPVNIINTTHDIILQNPIDQSIDENSFYIQLSRIFNGSAIFSNYTIQLTFNYINGIQIGYINNGVPYNPRQLTPFQIITEVIDENTYIIELLKLAGLAGVNGGNFVEISKITSMTLGYPNPNNYEIELEQRFYNIINIEIISSEFPNTQQIINNSNNKIYWENLDDGDYIYELILTNGNYTPESLKQEIENQFYNTGRINYDVDTTSNVISHYTNNNIVYVDIDINTSVVTFTSYAKNILQYPFVGTIPTISDVAGSIPTEIISNYKLIINHPNHGLKVGDGIIISNSISYMGIPTNIINTNQTISDVIDNNTYYVKLNSFNLENLRKNSKGGTSVEIYRPNIMRLLFNKNNTCGTILGFRDAGSETSITNYNNIIKNNEAYDNESLLDVNGNEKIITNNVLQLSGDDYILITCNNLNLNKINDIGNNKQLFGKIQLSGSPNRILFNTFVPMEKILLEPIPELSSLNLSFYSPSGNLYEFNGKNHSMTIKITTLFIIPQNTNIDSGTNKSRFINASSNII